MLHNQIVASAKGVRERIVSSSFSKQEHQEIEEQSNGIDQPIKP
jgi:hypothetical protein